jgi:hypothetical protein
MKLIQLNENLDEAKIDAFIKAYNGIEAPLAKKLKPKGSPEMIKAAFDLAFDHHQRDEVLDFDDAAMTRGIKGIEAALNAAKEYKTSIDVAACTKASMELSQLRNFGKLATDVGNAMFVALQGLNNEHWSKDDQAQALLACKSVGISK